MTPKRYSLPNPYFPYAAIADLLANSAAGLSISTGALSANRIWYMPCFFPASATLESMSFSVVASATGNYDMGVYDDSCTNLIYSLGSTAVSTNSKKTLTFPTPLRVHAGDLLYAAIVMSSATPTVVRFGNNSLFDMVASGWAQQAATFPLPATATPVTVIGQNFPMVVFGVR